MKSRTIFTGLMAVALCVGFGSSVIGGDLEISGFFDVVGNYQSSAGDKTSFGLGQAELDLARELSDNIAFEAAIAYNSEAGVFELGAAVIDIHLFGSEGKHRRPALGVKHSGVIVGQFDVPFGIDYKVYASIDRKLVSPPLAVDFTHEGWNDFGVQLYMDWTFGNFVAYGVNGFESSYLVSDAAHALSLGLSIGSEVNTTPANAFGTRVGLTPVPELEVGGSLAFGLNQSDKSEMLMFGGDLQYTVADFNFKGEYIQHSLNRSIEEETNKGYYFQALYNINQFFLTGRYGAFQPDGADWAYRYTIGAGYAVADAVEIRFESTINENSFENTNILQLVGGF
ncbi:MAG: hypothetical protein DRP51_02830 [Candidatus Zixiibacteriota bacterium]|nr:MAG: hypothetical protein DRP51_02830 [candidate division Zixibacteria bacterium]